MTVRVVVVCDHDGCDREVTAPWPDDEYVDIGPGVTLDGEMELPERGWASAGSPYSADPPVTSFGTPPRRDFCPDHAGHWH